MTVLFIWPLTLVINGRFICHDEQPSSPTRLSMNSGALSALATNRPRDKNWLLLSSTLVLSRPGYALVWLQLAHHRHLDTPLSVSPYGLANPRSACPGQHPGPSREQGCLVWRSDGISDASRPSTKAKHILDPDYSRPQSPLALQEQIHYWDIIQRIL